jgi:hypothetical protein
MGPARWRANDMGKAFGLAQNNDRGACERYLLRSLLIGVAVLGLVGAAMLAVDPYGVFGTRLVPDRLFAADRRLTLGGDRVIKGLLMLAERPRTLVAGSSRVAIGFDPQSPALADLDLYNAGLPGAAGPEILLSARVAGARVPQLSWLVLCLDFDLFFQTEGVASDFGESIFAGRPAAYGLIGATYAYAALETPARKLPALLSGRPIAGPVSLRGWLVRDVAMRGKPERPLFHDEIAGMGVKSLAATQSALAAEKAEQRYQDLAETLAQLLGRGVAVDVVLPPVHVWRLDLIEEFGLLPAYQAWKRRLTEIVAVAGRSGSARLFDFNVVDRLTSASPREAAPFGVDEFFEPSHFLPPLGDAIFAVLRAQSPADGDSGFGRQLRPAMLETHLEQTSASLAAWRLGHPGEAAEIRKVADDARAH